MRSLAAILIIPMFLASLSASAQDVIAIAERNNYGKPFSSGRKSHSSWIRPVFRKDGTGWHPIDSACTGTRLYEDGARKGCRISPANFLLPDGKIPTPGYANAGLHHCDGHVPATKRFPDPDSIFEHRDILKYAVLTTRPGSIPKSLSSESVNISFEDRRRIAEHLHERIRAWIRKNKPDIVLDTSYYAAPFMYREEFRSYLENMKILDCSIDSGGNKLISLKLPQPKGPTGVLHQLCQVFSLHGIREEVIPPRLFIVVRPDGKIQSFHADLHLLERGDFDRDGKDEYLFFSSSFNNYGYFLVYDDFHRTALYEWHYH